MPDISRPITADEKYCRQHCGVQASQFHYRGYVYDVNWEATRSHVENRFAAGYSNRTVGSMASDERHTIVLRSATVDWIADKK